MSASESEPEAGEPSVRFPDYRRKVSLSGVKSGYTLLCKHFTTVIFIPIAALLAYNLWAALQSGALLELYQDASQRELKLRLVTIVASACVLSLLGYLFFSSRAVYLVNFSCYKPPASMKTSSAFFIEGTASCKRFDDEAMAFQERVIVRSGLGDETYVPASVRMRPPVISMKNARLEAEMVMFGAVADVLAKTGLKPSDIGLLVVNCSLFNPTPSLAAMIINKFSMPHDTTHFNLSGMGCSAGLIAIDLAAKMLQLQSNQYALVVSTENITQNWYFGNNRSMLLPNCLFRMGASAVVLSNRVADARRAKYRLACPVVRTMTGGKNEAAYHCIYQMEDEDGNTGVKLTRQLMGEAGRALKQNITTLGPLVLPLSEQLLFFCNLIARKLFKMAVKAYIPDFRLAFDHFCIHTGGRAVIEEIEKQLKLRPEHVAPSKDTLFRFGNTSSSSIWYILANIETMRGVKRGDRIWQIGFGSGFKCNSAVWHALRNNTEKHVAWTDEEMETDPKWTDSATWENVQAEEAAKEAQQA